MTEVVPVFPALSAAVPATSLSPSDATAAGTGPGAIPLSEPVKLTATLELPGHAILAGGTAAAVMRNMSTGTGPAGKILICNIAVDASFE